jgi:uncharacterized protein YeaO (DUF488 family)
VYDPDEGGYRVLVDRLWPRGLRRDDAHLDEWAKEVAPSDELRRWYGHEVERFPAFAHRYRAELGRPPAAEALARLSERARRQPLTLLTATRDVEQSGARVLADALTEQRARRRRTS